MATPVEAPEKTTRVMTGQDRRLLALFTEHFPFDEVSTAVKQRFLDEKSGDPWKFLARQMYLYWRASADVQKLIIDCDAQPSCPKDLTIHYHRKHGNVEWSAAKFTKQKYLYLLEEQKNGKSLVGTKLREELKGKSVMNACVLDWLLTHPDQIPYFWKGKSIFFWGTIYSDSCDSLSVRYLHFNGLGCYTGYSWLGEVWDGDRPALLAE